VKQFKEPRIFVGTMFSGEAEFELCCQAIAKQQDVKVTHHVIRNMPEMEAHNKLWEAWNDVKSEYDLFAKIDADTILINDHSLKDVWELFSQDARVTGAQILLHDFFTDKLLAGLNFFSPKVEFNCSTNRLLPDRVDKNHDIILRGDEVAHLSPIGWHCKVPNSKQAFHFGLHRALKRQDDVIESLSRAWLIYRDDARAWAISGVLAANFWMRKNFDYDNKSFNLAFEKWNKYPDRLNKVMIFAKRFG
jgi:hypothetical protein